MAVTSGLSESVATASRRRAWEFSWPLIAGLVLFIFFTNASGLPLLADPDIEAMFMDDIVLVLADKVPCQTVIDDARLFGRP